jgi:hypothetical protein
VGIPVVVGRAWNSDWFHRVSEEDVSHLSKSRGLYLVLEVKDRLRHTVFNLLASGSRSVQKEHDLLFVSLTAWTVTKETKDIHHLLLA